MNLKLELCRTQLLISPQLAKLAALILTICYINEQGSQCQTMFQNLDFESTTIQQTQLPGTVSATEALPGWAVFIGTNQQANILYGQTTLGQSSVDLIGTNAASGLGGRSLDGFSVLLQGGVIGAPGGDLYPAAASISQTGFIPSTAKSIEFAAINDTSGVLTILLDGVNIPFFNFSNTLSYALYRGDVSAFAGHTAELEFSVSRLADRAQGNWEIDSIQFSDIAIPEPNLVALISLGTLVLGYSVLGILPRADPRRARSERK